MSENAITATEKKAAVTVGAQGVTFGDLESLWRFASAVAKSGFAPKGVDTPEKCLVAIEMGLEIGLRPMQAIQNVAVINGRPTVWGDAAKALVMGSGFCESCDEWFEGEAYKDGFMAICETKRAGQKPVRWEFSVADAKLAGLWAKDGPWKTYPKRMLQMRARSFALRDAYPDVLRGVWLAEEAQDMPRVQVDNEAGNGPESLDDIADKLEAETAKHESDLGSGEELDEETGEITSEEEAGEPETAAMSSGDGTLF